MDIQVKYATMIVKDMDESIRFYSEVIGFDVDSQFNPQPGVMITLMKGKGDAMVELIKDAVHEAGFYSVGMDVKDLTATIKALKSKGAKITMEPVPTLAGSLAFMEDPNGVRIALIEHNEHK